MAAFVGRLNAITRETGAAVPVVRHPGKDDARGMRGSTVLFAACDAVIKIAANGNIRQVVTEKVKEGVVGGGAPCRTAIDQRGAGSSSQSQSPCARRSQVAFYEPRSELGKLLLGN